MDTGKQSFLFLTIIIIYSVGLGVMFLEASDTSDFSYVSPDVYFQKTLRSAKFKDTHTVSGYSKEDTCPDHKCKMANGKEPTTKYAACPRNVKLGTKILVEGYGERICGDRLSEKFDNRFDLWFNTKKEAIKFGLKRLNIYVLR